jgi:hypothetical protein
MIYPLESDLGPVITGEIFKKILKDKEWQLDEIARCREEPWYSLVNYNWTIRRDEQGSYVERVPAKEYLRLMADDWYKHPLYAVSKSRQMMATWLFILLHLHCCLYNENIHVCCQTKKEEDADSEMIQRANFAYSEMPVWMRKFSPTKYSFCKLLFPKSKSIMRGIPAGGAQIRSHNPNYLLSDETAFQPDADDSYTAALPCCQRITIVTSANPGWADDFFHDKLKVDG